MKFISSLISILFLFLSFESHAAASVQPSPSPVRVQKARTGSLSQGKTSPLGQVQSCLCRCPKEVPLLKKKVKK